MHSGCVPGLRVAGCSGVYARRTLACVILLVACGSDEASGPPFQVLFDISRGSRAVLCEAVPEIVRVEVRVFADGESRLRPGFPQDADCFQGTFATRDLTPGRYDFEVLARGAVGEDQDAVLFRAIETLTVPDDDGAAIRLEPQVAYLTLAWTFGDDLLAPCATEVDRIRVLVSTGTSQVGNFAGFYGCTETEDTGVFIPMPFTTREYTVQVDAESASGYPLFSHSVRRFLERGNNTYTAVLVPLGGQVFVDWEFVIDEDRIRMCDAARVEVERLFVHLEGLEGGGVDVRGELSCEESRPAAVRGVRFTQGRQLRLELEASGTHADFYGERTFIMPDGDYRDALIDLERVGSATVSIQVITSTCTPPEGSVYDVRLTFDGSAEPVRETMLGSGVPLSVGYDRLLYGTYDVEVTQRLDQVVSCMTTDQRVIDGSENIWLPIFL